jgi:hypothetical protein
VVICGSKRAESGAASKGQRELGGARSQGFARGRKNTFGRVPDVAGAVLAQDAQREDLRHMAGGPHRDGDPAALRPLVCLDASAPRGCAEAPWR